MLKIKIEIYVDIEVSGENDRLPTRRELAKKFRCHFNTLRDDELLIKQWVADASDLYSSTNQNKLEAITLTPYLVWLLAQVRNMRVKGNSRKQIIKFLFQNPQNFTREAFDFYVNDSKNRRARVA